MIKSMTGFGRCEVQKENRKFTVELKSVNHRYLDVNIRMPKKLNFFETSIRTLLKSYASRGKVDIFITYEDASQSQVSVRYHDTTINIPFLSIIPFLFFSNYSIFWICSLIFSISVFSPIARFDTSRSLALERIVFASRFISCAIKSSFLPIPSFSSKVNLIC